MCQEEGCWYRLTVINGKAQGKIDTSMPSLSKLFRINNQVVRVLLAEPGLAKSI